MYSIYILTYQVTHSLRGVLSSKQGDHWLRCLSFNFPWYPMDFESIDAVEACVILLAPSAYVVAM